MIKYQYVYTQNAKKEFGKIDSYQQKKINIWITQRIENSVAPRRYGKTLSGSLQKYCSYRIGDYRVICEIDDTNRIIQIITIGHRSDIYNKIIREEEIIYKTQ